ncbi:hypothetical protein [Streptomyces sp. NPDC045714]|uniref:hypothetical protein n=1 Tax=Streptomyces sp. NPDC045714 TaxID=3154913 RepID=UPI0034000A2D
MHGSRGEKTLKRPLILSDGCAPGGTNVDELYDGLENGQYPFISTLRQAGFDIILLGFADRTASILDNAPSQPSAFSGRSPSARATPR